MSPARLSAYLSAFAEEEGYLDFARVGPPSRAVVEAGTAALAAVSAAGLGTVDELMGAEGRALAAASRLLGFPPGNVAYSPSTSAGLFQAAFAVRGPVLVSPAEFPANLYPWWRAESAGRLDVVPLPAGPVTPDVVRAAPDAAALVVSAVDFATGFRADLPGLREVLGERLLVVDAIQGLGAVDVDWTAADVLVAGGQKWLRSGWSTGVVAVSDRALERLDPLLAGWTAVQDATDYDGEEHPLAAGAARFGTTNTSPVAQACLAAGLELLESAGVGSVAGRIAARVEELLELLDRRGVVVTSSREPAERAGIVAFRVPGVDGAELHAALGRAGVTCTRHGERVRLSVHATTTPAALQRVDDALALLGATAAQA
ncbi:aminotransferase class V-fold PLP-dependent enzyme [Modestobacter sp. VKM Ac-2977]|uniref:aminotransferase class V-fold PLP-dependent enzyme n=1 Tax=Modestobacter sp. VKM Ac-2977 TaxID=3004131 RepID=UPI0022A9FB5D|nr:aminotransferase class V-fold PLP-dependent enzyme [Modestobacter sp. VKM Ac-2977]MCZ2821230.1 aminotransferase class V-fold PLP-dependent enzyme [Modestobacter sp. VKM Ac-2977]